MLSSNFVEHDWIVGRPDLMARTQAPILQNKIAKTMHLPDADTEPVLFFILFYFIFGGKRKGEITQ